MIRTVLIGVCLATGSESISQAAEWSVLPSISMRGYYNSNLLLTPLPHEATYGYWVSPGAEFAGKTERLSVSGRAALDFVDYYGGQQDRFTNIHFPLTAMYRTEKDQFGFTGGFVRDNTLMGELLSTGLVLSFTQRNLLTANPTWSRNLTERLVFEGAFQFSHASYEDGLRLGLVNYQVLGGSAGFRYHLTEQDEIQLTGAFTEFRTVGSPSELRATYPGAILTFTHAFTETLKATAYGGPRFVHSTSQVDGGTHKTSDAVWVYGASLSKEFESGSLQVAMTRDIYPSGFGLLIQNDRIGATTSYKMSETVTASFDASGYFVSSLTASATGRQIPDTQFFYLTPSVAWKFAEWWKVEASYTYRWRDVETFVEPAMANALMLMLTYYPPKLAISH
ncbi:MAG: hypothetical protein AB7G68_04450 [Nitrospiraceae bacterium]